MGKATMKAKGAKKAKRVSKIVHGKIAKALVFRGSKEKTAGSLTKASLIKNKRGKIVSKKAAAAGRESFKNVKTWVDCHVAARKELRLKGFVALNGKSRQGKELYAKT